MRAGLACVLCACSHALAAQVTAVYPSGPELPQNALRITIAFETPQRDVGLDALTLDVDGVAAHAPFVPVPLWSPDRRRLTAVLHPGRQKQGLHARDVLGPIVQDGAQIRLALRGDTLKTWTGARADVDGPDPAQWTIAPPPAGARDALDVVLDAPIDAQAAGLIAVANAAGERVSGTATLIDHERRWRFVPDMPWTSGEHRVVAHPTLEDAAGNRVGARFEHAAGDATATLPTSVTFQIR